MLGIAGRTVGRRIHTAKYIRRAAAATPIALLGAAVWTEQRRQKTRLDGLQLLPASQTLSLVIPTLEATGRAFRLVSTAFLIVLDYEKAKLWPKWFSDLSSSELDALVVKRGECQDELRRAQIEYTSELSDGNIDPGSVEYKQLKENQKKAVLEAAEALADLEEEMAKHGANEVHHRAANRLLKLCRDNGGVYIKVGQHLANLDYLIPPEYIEVLSSLFDAAPLTSYSDVCQVIQEDLGKHPDEVFSSFEKDPIASASLAQVHVAVEKDTGRKLAVKVQHRGLRETSSGDIFALQTVVSILDSLFEGFTWSWISDEIAPQLPKELDFINEGRNAERASAAIKESGVDCVVPEIVWKHSSGRVLCMEFEEGFKATDTEAMEKAGLRKRDVAKLISSVFNSQIFLSAFVHCDPHPANVLLRARNGKPQIVLLDHGLYKALDDDFRIKYANLWQALMVADLPEIKKSCSSLGVDEMYTLFAAMLTSRPFDEIIERSKTGSLAPTFDPDSKSDRAMIQGYAHHFFQDIIDMLGRLPRQMLLLLKMNDCLRHIDYTLGSPTNTLVVAGRYAARAVHEHRLAHPGSSFRDRLKAWWDYYGILLRIRIHDVVVWWTHSKSDKSLLNIV